MMKHGKHPVFQGRTLCGMISRSDNATVGETVTCPLCAKVITRTLASFNALAVVTWDFHATTQEFKR